MDKYGKMYKNLSVRSKKRKIREEIEAVQVDDFISVLEPSSNIPSSDFESCTVENNSNTNASTGEKRRPIHSFIPDITENNDYDNDILHEEQLLDVSFDNIESDNMSPESFCFELAKWAILFKITHNALNGLLILLKKHKCFYSLPKDARTVLKTKLLLSESIRDVMPGSYYHFGIENGIVRHFLDGTSIDEIKLVVGIDGLPITKSNSTQFWPILAYMRPFSSCVFPIGIYCGTQKPADSNEYLIDFITEAKNIIVNGIYIFGKFYKVVIDVFCCDIPAKAFILKIKGHNGFNSCTRCEIEGEFLDNRLCFPYSEPSNRPPNRNHSSYVERSQINHHVSSSNSCLTEIPGLDIVGNFSLDYLHLVCLGVVKKLMILWMKGPLNVRLPSRKINQLSEQTMNLKSVFLCEFSRKPRTLLEVARWKATEFRSFLLYVGPIVLEDILSDHCYKNFMTLSVAMTILLSPGLGNFVQYARDLLEYFVKSFEQIYGRHLISSNIHGLIHLVDDYQRYGPLDQCSCFPFENYMKVIKMMLRKPDKPLEQVIKRYHEGENLVIKTNAKNQNLNNLLGSHDRGPLLDITINPQYSTLDLKKFKIKSKIDADSYFCTNSNIIVKLLNIAHLKENREVVLIGRQFKKKIDFYTQPIKSSNLSIYIVQQLSLDLNYWRITDVKTKMMIFPYNNDLVAIPLLHTI